VPEGGGVGVSAGVGDGLSSVAGLGDGLGFLRFDLLFGDGLGDGVDKAFFCFRSGVGDGVGVAFFFRCLRVGVGDGSKTFLIFVPNDSSAASAAEAPNKSAPSKKQRIIVLRAIDVVGRFTETPITGV
jgi:hypothetical protein